MPILKSQSIVLRRFDFRETSLIVRFLTREFGKISGILKGIRKDPRKFASTVELFSHNEIVFYKSRNSSLHLVSQCDAGESFLSLRNNLGRIGVASFMMELVDAVMPDEDKNIEVYNLVLTALRELNNSTNHDKIMTIFKIKLLTLSGFRPHLDSCIVCNNESLGLTKFSLQLGGMLCQRCVDRDRTSRNIFRGTVATILYIEKNDFKNNLNLGFSMEIKRELDMILNSFIRFHLEKELNSLKVLRKIEFMPLKTAGVPVVSLVGGVKGGV